MTVENPHGIHIDLTQFTNNVVLNVDNTVTGEGIFDVLMEVGNKHITAQFDAGRIRGEDFATAYMQIYQTTLGAAVQIWLQKPLAELQKESEAAKKELFYRQIQGFDEDFKQKILKICMDAWTVGFSVAKDSFQATGVPGPMQKNTIDDLFNNFIAGSMESWPYGRDPSAINRGASMSMEEMIKTGKMATQKLTAVNQNVAASSKTTQQQLYNTTMLNNVESQLSYDINDIPAPAPNNP